MKIDAEEFRVHPGRKVKLKDWPAKVKPFYCSHDDYKHRLRRHLKELKCLQERFLADKNCALLLIFQGMDAAGKDSVIKHVMSGANPQGYQVFSFKRPSSEEWEHDFLWRTTRQLPERGHIGIFNRSYYEEVLIVRVHPGLLRKEGLGGELRNKKQLWRHRFESITDFEKHLSRNGTQVIKFFLHLSREEQRRRFLRRIDCPGKNWKFEIEDMRERKFWNKYTAAHEECLEATTSAFAPWYVIPADDKKNVRLIVSHLIVAALKAFKLRSQTSSPKRKRELASIRQVLARE